MSYWRFAVMVLTSTVVMFGLMYVHTNAWDDVYFSETRAWMALLMGAVMAIVMLGFMWQMYPHRSVNVGIVIGSALVLAVSAWLVRSQASVDSSDYMEAMVPHHSIAILTSTRAGIDDQRVRKLADEVIESQRKEIAEMKYLIRALARGETRDRPAEREPAEVTSAAEAVSHAELATMDLEGMSEPDLQQVLGTAATCRFSYAHEDAPVAVATAPGTEPGRGVIRLHGRLVLMEVRYPAGAQDGFELSSGDVSVTAGSQRDVGGDEPSPAEALLTVGGDLEVGYAGFYRCRQS